MAIRVDEWACWTLLKKLVHAVALCDLALQRKKTGQEGLDVLYASLPKYVAPTALKELKSFLSLECHEFLLYPEGLFWKSEHIVEVKCRYSSENNGPALIEFSFG